MIDLGTIGGNGSEATGINNEGQVVGYSYTSSGLAHAFIWNSGTMTDLGTLGGNNSVAFDINDAGQVVGYSSTSTSSGQTHAFLNNPPAAASEPATVLLLGIGLVGVAGVRRKMKYIS
jgi:probable HAF family extracellular repeat protein